MLCNSLIMDFPLQRIGGHEPRNYFAILHEPDGAQFRSSSTWCVEDALDHVALAERRILLTSDLVVSRMPSQGACEHRPFLSGKPKTPEESRLMSAIAVSFREQVVNDLGGWN